MNLNNTKGQGYVHGSCRAACVPESPLSLPSSSSSKSDGDSCPCNVAGNFLLLNDDEQAPLKAIDFGLAVRFDPAALPMEDLGLEGTPWWGLLLILTCLWGILML